MEYKCVRCGSKPVKNKNELCSICSLQKQLPAPNSNQEPDKATPPSESPATNPPTEVNTNGKNNSYSPTTGEKPVAKTNRELQTKLDIILSKYLPSDPQPPDDGLDGPH